MPALLTAHIRCRSAMKNMFISCPDMRWNVRVEPTAPADVLAQKDRKHRVRTFRMAVSPTADTLPSAHCMPNSHEHFSPNPATPPARGLCVPSGCRLRVVRRTHRPWCKSWRVAECDARRFRTRTRQRYAYVAIAVAPPTKPKHKANPIYK